MPKRSKTELIKYRAITPDLISDDALRAYINSLPCPACGDAAIDVLARNPGIAARAKTLANSGGPKEPTDWPSQFLDCETFFKSQPVLPDKFALFGWFYCHSLGPTLLLPVPIWNESHRAEIQAALDHEKPFRWGYTMYGMSSTTVDLYLFGAQLWEHTREDMTANSEELRFLYLEAVDKDRVRFERLRNKFGGGAGKAARPEREHIPESVRIFVWRRDEGRCVECGSQERLEYDHLIPVSKGGSSTERNIRLLCEACNRKKGDRI